MLTLDPPLLVVVGLLDLPSLTFTRIFIVLPPVRFLAQFAKSVHRRERLRPRYPPHSGPHFFNRAQHLFFRSYECALCFGQPFNPHWLTKDVILKPFPRSCDCRADRIAIRCMIAAIFSSEGFAIGLELPDPLFIVRDVLLGADDTVAFLLDLSLGGADTRGQPLR